MAAATACGSAGGARRSDVCPATGGSLDLNRAAANSLLRRLAVRRRQQQRRALATRWGGVPSAFDRCTLPRARTTRPSAHEGPVSRDPRAEVACSTRWSCFQAKGRIVRRCDVRVQPHRPAASKQAPQRAPGAGHGPSHGGGCCASTVPDGGGGRVELTLSRQRKRAAGTMEDRGGRVPETDQVTGTPGDTGANRELGGGAARIPFVCICGLSDLNWL